MKFIKICFMSIILISNFTFYVFPQVDSSAQDGSAIESVLNPEYDQNYNIEMYYADSLVGKRLDGGYYESEDPNHLLKGCVLFAAINYNGSLDSSIFGIYKNGSILWNSKPVIKGGWLKIKLIRDINKEGKIDIVTTWWMGQGGEDMWIFSWDGVSGKIINDYYDSSSVFSGESKLHGTLNTFEMCDVNEDGVLEIRTMMDSSYIAFSWNGNLYGNWPDTPKIPANYFFPANLLIMECQANVTFADNLFNYSYTWTNDSSSSQSAISINLYKTTTEQNISAPNDWIGTSGHYQSFRGIGWITIYTDNALIEPGESKKGYTVTSVNPPKIVDYYVQGYRIEPETISNSTKLTTEDIWNDRLNNSFHGYTIGPTDSISTFTSIRLLDSLLEYSHRTFQLDWIKNLSTANKYVNYFNTAKTQLQQNNIAGVKSTLNQVLQDVNQDSTSNLTSEAYALIRYNTEYLLAHLPNSNLPSLGVKLENSSGNLLTGGTLQYYDGSWKDATNNGDGTFGINTTKSTLSLRMTYAYGSQTVSNVPAQNNTYTFQTKDVSVQLKNSIGSLIDTGTVQCYAGAWRNFGITTNGVATKELLPNTYSFRMTYAHASNDKQQDIGTNSTVVFQTVNANIQLENSQGSPIDVGTVQYYAGAWRDFGTTTNGSVTKELLPNNYSFRMTYAYANNDKQQDIGTNPTVVFQTVNANVQLQNRQGNLIDTGTVQYYAGAWRSLGTTANGSVTKELLPDNYSFRMTYAHASNDKQQNIGTNPTVVFRTVNANIQLENSQGSPIDVGTVQYYADAWRDFGTTTNGVASKELLPNNYSFRMIYAYANNDKQQNIGANPTVVFQTVKANIQLQNSQGNLIDTGTVQYYAGAWRNIGTTTNGSVSIELLPNTYSFRMTYDYLSNDISQNVGTNNTVKFSTVLCTISVNNSQNQPVSGADIKYYAGAWREIGQTVNGQITKELLPKNISFRMNYNSVQQDKNQDISTNPLVQFNTGVQ